MVLNLGLSVNVVDHDIAHLGPFDEDDRQVLLYSLGELGSYYADIFDPLVDVGITEDDAHNLARWVSVDRFEHSSHRIQSSTVSVTPSKDFGQLEFYASFGTPSQLFSCEHEQVGVAVRQLVRVLLCRVDLWHRDLAFREHSDQFHIYVRTQCLLRLMQ